MRATWLGLTGFALIAVSYGLARFAWGVMLPDVMRDISFTPQLAGMLSACSFIAYCLAILAAPLLSARAGPRLPAFISSLSAASGLLLIAVAHSEWLLALGLFIAGLSAGLASPAIAAAVSQTIADTKQPKMNMIINAGTSAGIIVSVPVLFWLPGGWRMACTLFALLALLCAFPVWRILPKEKLSAQSAPLPGFWRHRALQRLMAIAFVSGIASAAWWSFGPELLHRLGMAQGTISLLWVTAGAAGIAGALTAPLASVIAMKQIYRLSQCCLALPLLLIAFSQHFSWWLFPSVALGGAGYVTLSGVLLVWGAAATESAPATGVSALFFMLALGQVVGSMLFGQIYALTNSGTALLIFAALPLLLVFAIRKQHRRV
ncbi:MFS transporter [Chimaeribacter californicus]|uniref:MFS transporter n=1 Tax=Chimaeribacter californicus TaxID=2060067 RepID=A0A2N5EBV1_9GAMM|nr:MFS transporter [Chimaeribacter californicus]PLR39595.1 MFS transporter [Chimaeribacter californicus]